MLDRRGSAGIVDTVTINGREIDVTQSVGPETERAGDEARDRFVLDLPKGIDPGEATIRVEERFGPQGELGSEVSEVQALITEGAPEVDNQAFEERSPRGRRRGRGGGRRRRVRRTTTSRRRTQRDAKRHRE